MAKNKYQIRFNLGRGVNYEKWKVTNPYGEVIYLDPSEVLIIMKGCKLVNHKGTAQKIFEGANKRVGAWVECDEVEVTNKPVLNSSARKVCYNPRVEPNWTLDDENVDKQEFDELFTADRSIRLAE